MADLWNRKMRTVFKRFDFDDDGILSEKGYLDYAENIIKGGNLKGQKAEAVRNSLKKVHPYVWFDKYIELI